MPRGLVDDLARLVVGAELRPPAVAALGGRFCLAMFLHDACHSIDSSDIGSILEIVKFPNSSRAENRHDRPFHRLPDRSAGRPRPSPRRCCPQPPRRTAALAAKKFNLRKMLLTGAAIAVLAGAAWYGWDYWTVGQYLVSTDDAYVKADSTTIAPKVTGYLHQVLVKDNERVATGQVLARIDDRDFKVALDQAKADVAAAEATIASKQAQLEVQQAVINAAKATHRCRPGRGDLRRPGKQALHRSRRDRFRQRAERAAGAGADCRRAGRTGARQRQSRLGAEAGRSAQGRDRAGQRGAGARRGAAAPGRTQSRLHHDHRADRRRRRQPHAARRPISCRPERN